MITPSDRERFNNQKEVILSRLQNGPVYNVELGAIGLGYRARLTELRQEGHNIVCTAVPGTRGLTTYELMGFNP